MSSAATFYNTIAKVYPVLDVFLQPAKKYMLKQLNAEPAGPMLEIGVGRGDYLGRYTHRPIEGIDVSEGMLAYARKQCPDYCRLQIMDAAKLDFDSAAFEYCVISHVLSVVPEADAVLREVWRVLRPGGKVFILNHESSGDFREKLNSHLEPVAKLLHFSARFSLDSLVNPDHFSVVHKSQHGWLPSITLLVLQKKRELPA